MDGKGNRVGTEAFRCASGPAGWRYFSEIETSEPEPHREVLDLVVDAEWRPLRLRIDTGSHGIMLQRDGDRLRGVRDGEPLDLEARPDLDYLSPAFNAATANRLRGTEEIEVWYLDPVTCEPHLEGQRYDLEAEEEEVATPVGQFRARRWRYTALRSGFTRPLWVAGDVVVAYEDVFALTEYEPGRGPVPT
jgi:hypothetical protein